METLRGQNLRVLTYNADGDLKATVIAKATNCVVTLNTTASDATTKDDVGNASKSEITAKGWTVQVDSLDVTRIDTFMNAAKNGQKLCLLFERVSTTDNQSVMTDSGGNSFGRYGDALVTDLTYTFNDRENSSFNVQFTGTGKLYVNDESTPNVIDVDDNFTKGQFVRLFVSDVANPTTPVAAAKQLSIHVSVQTENSTTKDTDEDWDEFVVVGVSYDISTNALIYTGQSSSLDVNAKNLANFIEHYEASDLMYWEIAKVSGDHNRVKGNKLLSGQARITQLTINAQNRQVANYTVQLSGYGAYTAYSYVTPATTETH